MAITSSSSSFDNEVLSCSKAYLKAYAQLHSQYDKLTDDFRKSQFDVLSYQARLESVEARLVVYKQNKSILEENIKLLNIEVQARDTALVTLRQKTNLAEQKRDDLKLKPDKFQTSSKNLTELLASQTNEKHGLGYFSSESDCENLSPSSLSDRSQPNGGYHVVPPLIIGTFMPPKPDLVFHATPINVETDHSAFTVQIARVANPLALVAQQQQVYHHQTHPTHFNQNSSIRTHQAATRKREKDIVNSPQPIYDQEPSMVVDDEDTSKDKEIDKLMALISLSFKKIYKPTNNNLRTLSNTSRANLDNSPRIHRNAGYEARMAAVCDSREAKSRAEACLISQTL
nr:hypothetical protein [Tanacetum cinerariifolium]